MPPQTEDVARQIVDGALSVHRALGPGLLESVYEVCLCHELHLRGIAFQSQLPLPVVYKGMRLETEVRIDLMVEDCVLVELKCVETMSPIFDAQLLTYLKLTGKRLGLLINFNVPLLKNGIKRIVH
ncbi:MAG TPA: GxxExxY protein [Planctomycetaceae bacterium]|nr:GxxExxY protein [Planctomycetaceae bacterium]